MADEVIVAAGQIVAAHIQADAIARGWATIYAGPIHVDNLGVMWSTGESKAATKRSFELLDRYLSPDQRQCLAWENCIYEIGGETGWLYKIFANHHSIQVVTGKMMGYYNGCIYVYGCPHGDSMLALKWAVQFKEKKLWKKMVSYVPVEFDRAVQERKRMFPMVLPVAGMSLRP